MTSQYALFASPSISFKERKNLRKKFSEEYYDEESENKNNN